MIMLGMRELCKNNIGNFNLIAAGILGIMDE